MTKLYNLIIFFIISLCFISCKSKDTSENSVYKVKKISCDITNEESFDTIIEFNGNKTQLSCITECYGDFVVGDTIKEDSTINLYQNRLFRFHLKNQFIDTSFTVTKELLKESYKENSTYQESIIYQPKIDSIDYKKQSIVVNCAFLFPAGKEGTDFFELVKFEITSNGKVILNKIISLSEGCDEGEE